MFIVGGEGFEPPKAYANGFTVRPGSPTPASARNFHHKDEFQNFKSNKFIVFFIFMQIFFKVNFVEGKINFVNYRKIGMIALLGISIPTRNGFRRQKKFRPFLKNGLKSEELFLCS